MAIKWKKPFNRTEFKALETGHSFIDHFRAAKPGIRPDVKVEGVELGDRMKTKKSGDQKKGA